MNFLKNKKVMGFLVFLVIVIILAVSLSSGALKFNITATRTPSTETTTTTGNEFETEQSVTKMPQKQKVMELPAIMSHGTLRMIFYVQP